MAGHIEFQQQNKVTFGFTPAALATATRTGAFWTMADAHHVAVVFIIGAVTAAVTLSVIQGKKAGATGGTTATISGKSLVIGTADALSVKIIEVEASELNVASAYLSIAAKAVAAGGGAVVGATVIRTPLRREPSSLVT